MIDRTEILRVARGYVQVPYQHQGRGLNGSGLDCLGYIFRVAWDLGLPAEDDATYTPQGDRRALVLACQAQMVSIPIAEARPGDVLQIADTSLTCHLAFLGDGGHPYTLLHASLKWQRVIEHGYVRPWPAWTIAAYRLPGEIAPWPS